MPGKGNALIERLQLDGQSLGLERAAKREEGILRRENVGITQPADKPTVFDPRSPRDNLRRTVQIIEKIDQAVQDLAGRIELGRLVQPDASPARR